MQNQVFKIGSLALAIFAFSGDSGCLGGKIESTPPGIPSKINQMVVCADVRGDARSNTILDWIDISAGVQDECAGTPYKDYRLGTNIYNGRGCTFFGKGVTPPSGYLWGDLPHQETYVNTIATHYKIPLDSTEKCDLVFNTYGMGTDLLGAAPKNILCLKPSTLIGSLGSVTDQNGAVTRPSRKVSGYWDGYDYDVATGTLYVYSIFDFDHPAESPGDMVQLKLQKAAKKVIEDAFAALAGPQGREPYVNHRRDASPNASPASPTESKKGLAPSANI